MKKILSLSTLAAAVTASALIVAMGLYAILQHVRTGTAWEELLLTHAWHVVALTAMVEIALVVILRRAVVDPIHGVNKHLYGVATGHLEPLVLNSRVEEVRELVDGVNAMVKRLEMSRDEDALDHSDEDLAALAELVRELDPDNAEAILRLSRIGRALASVPRPSSAPPPANGELDPHTLASIAALA